jgi:hypothetical protein
MDNAFPCQTAGVKIPCQTASNLETSFSVADQRAIQNRYDNMERRGSGGWEVGMGGLGGDGWQDWFATTDAELEIIGRLSPEVRMLALGLKPYA